jgi:very-short-patch-repair endonuclease
MLNVTDIYNPRSIKKATPKTKKTRRTATSIEHIYENHLRDVGLSIRKVRDWYAIGSRWARLISAGTLVSFFIK